MKIKLCAAWYSSKNPRFKSVALYYSVFHLLCGNPRWFCRVWVKEVHRHHYRNTGLPFGQSFGRTKFKAYRRALEALQ